MNKPKSFFAAGLLVAVLGACVAGALALRASSRETVLKLAHGLDVAHPVHQGMLFMADRVKALTGGQLKIDIYSGGVLGGETECLEQVQMGALAMTKVSTAALESFIPAYKIFGVPFLFRDGGHYLNVLHGAIGEAFLTRGRPANFIGLCYYDAGSRSFYSTKKKIFNEPDVDGMKVRVMNSKTAFDMIEAMSGSPCPITWGELYTALSQGTVDAAENNPPTFLTSRHNEVAKYFSLTEHQRIPDMLIISTEVWDALPPAHQAALGKAAKESEAYQRKLWAEANDKAMATLRELGTEIITPAEGLDLDSFRKVCVPILQKPFYADVRELYTQIQEVR